MCGIVGYVGEDEAAPILLHSLSRLEYRGYDSAGIAVRKNDLKPMIVKAEGKLSNLIMKTDDGKSVKGNSGIGHTRWATHGLPTESNAHPHHSDDYNVIGVHNGIIENYEELKEKLLHNGYKFYSQTDTEVIIKLIDYYCKKYKKGPIDAINKAMVRARGSYALVLMFKNYPGELWFAKKGSPLIVAKGKNASYLASDVPAIIKFSNQVYYVDDYECGRITKDSITFYDLNGDDITSKKELTHIDMDASTVDKGEYSHFMLKEIEEQPKAITDTLRAYLKNGEIDFSDTGLTDDILKDIKNVYIYACGSAYHTGVVAQYIMEEISGINVRVELASEFKYRNYKMRDNALCIVVSQSGETKDTHEALLKCKQMGIKTAAICNVPKSTITRDADFNLYTYAGPEIAVATTKAYSCQLIVFYLLALQFSKINNVIKENEYLGYINELQTIPSKVQQIIDRKDGFQKNVSRLLYTKDFFYIGRGIDYAVCLEGALKLKEITYVNAVAYPAGELKHGTISLIDEHVFVVACATQDELYEKMKSNMIEVKSRKGKVLAVVDYGKYDVEEASIAQEYLPNINNLFTASIAIIPMQLMAYYLSVAKGIDPDKPKNLAKSVTVE